MIRNSREIVDAQEIAKTFNEYFSNIGNRLASSIPSTIPSTNVPPLSYMNPPQTSSFFLSPITRYEIEQEIIKLNPTKATGPFSIPIKLLKILNTYLSKPLEVLFNSFSSGRKIAILSGVVLNAYIFQTIHRTETEIASFERGGLPLSKIPISISSPAWLTSYSHNFA